MNASTVPPSTAGPAFFIAVAVGFGVGVAVGTSVAVGVARGTDVAVGCAFVATTCGLGLAGTGGNLEANAAKEQVQSKSIATMRPQPRPTFANPVCLLYHGHRPRRLC